MTRNRRSTRRTSSAFFPTDVALHFVRVSCCVSVVLLLGCSRAFYRNQADDQAYCLVDQVGRNPRWPMDNFTIQPDPRSRMASPNNPDFPPMPPDDPAAHRYMECVDCKRGSRKWSYYGTTPFVANPYWRQYLPINENGVLVLDRQAAVQTALIQSSDYQSQLEELYLSALDVTFERFRFDTQFFGGSSVFFTADGPLRAGRPEGSSVLDVSPLSPGNQLRGERLFAAGGELVMGLANSIVWEFAGPNRQSTFTLLDFSLFQPLLRGAGRARVMERLTLAERTLLSNVRQMERFRRGFYVEITTGGSAGPGPSRRGGFFGGAGLEGFSGVGGGGFGRVGGVGGGVGFGGAGAAQAGGFLGLLQDAQEIRNQEATVAGLRDSVAQFQAAYEAGRIDRFQVDLARQALYDGQSALINRQAAYQTELDGYKVELGLPPDLPIRIEDTLLDQFQLLTPALVDVQYGVGDLLDVVRSSEQVAAADDIRRRVGQLMQSTYAMVEIVQRDFARLNENLPRRREYLQRLAERPEVRQGIVDRSVLDVDALDWRVDALRRDFQKLQQNFATTGANLEEVSHGTADLEALRMALRGPLTRLSGELLELSLIQARARLDTVYVSPIELTQEQAYAIARDYRLDLMNARSQLVDRWRLIEFNANDLLSGLDITFEGDIRNTGNNPLRLDAATGRLRAGVEFDAPLTRLAERNIYRQALIEYQQARRDFYRFRDGINLSLRNTLRNLSLNELNLELRRAAVLVAISQVDLTSIRLARPPQPGVESQLGDTTARDLIDAQASLLNVQNQFLSVWLDYQVRRLRLDFDLGTMRLDAQGMWIDPGSDIGVARYGHDVCAPPEVDAAPELIGPAAPDPDGIELLPEP